MIEVLVVITILSVVGVVFAAAATQGFSVTTQAAQSLDDAAARTVLVSRMTDDLRGAASAGASGGPSCDGPTGTSRVLWIEQSNASEPIVIYVTSSTPDRTTLSRISCMDGSASDAVVLAQWPSAEPPQVICDGGPVCSATAALGGAAEARDNTLDVADASVLPTAGPYDISVDGEQMTVTAGFGSPHLTVNRPAPVSHPAGDLVTYNPMVVSVTVPLTSPGAVTITADRRTP